MKGRRFAMMAAQGLVKLWFLLILTVMCLSFVISDSRNGMYCDCCQFISDVVCFVASQGYRLDIF